MNWQYDSDSRQFNPGRETPPFRQSIHCCGLLVILLCVGWSSVPASIASETKLVSFVGQTQVSRLGSHFSGNKTSRSIAPFIWMTVVPILAALGVSALYQYHQTASVHLDSPQKLFRELGKAHQLSWEQRRTLREAADLCELETPAALFVRPDLFDRAHQTMASVKGEKAAWRMTLLRNQLFSSISEETTSP